MENDPPLNHQHPSLPRPSRRSVSLEQILVPGLPGALSKMPNTTADLSGQTMAQFAGEHDYLSAMVTFVRDEVGQNMRDVEGKVAPDIRGGGGNCSASVKTKRKQIDDTAATVSQG